VRSFQREFAALHRIRHDHLPRYYERFEQDGNGYLVMEMEPGQSLLHILIFATRDYGFRLVLSP